MIILPYLFSVPDFGYWSLYVFYTGYIGLFCLGYNDGIYLKYGDKNYNELPHQKIRSASMLFLIMLALFTIMTVLCIPFIINDNQEIFAMQFAALNIFILGINGVLIHVLQITNQMKKYSFFSLLDKVAVIITVLLMFLINRESWKFLICVDFITKIISISIMVYLTKELWVGSLLPFEDAWKEFKENICIGSKLMFAGIFGMLLIGLGRIFIQFKYDIEAYSVYSFSISITSVVLTCVNAFSLVLYPAIKRIQQNNYSGVFISTNTCTRVFFMFAIMLYFPAYFVVNRFYVEYVSVLNYLHLMFVIIALQVKISILNNTFYKILRREHEMMRANLSTIIFFTVLLLLCYTIYDKIIIVPICTLVAIATRCYFSEKYLSNCLNIPFSPFSLAEVIFIIIFLLLICFKLPLLVSFILMSLVLLIILFINKNDIYVLYSRLFTSK